MPGAAVASPADDDLSNRINFGTATANASTLGALSGAEIQIPALDIILGAAARKVTSGLAAVATEAALLSGAALEWGSAILGVAGGAAPVVATGYLMHKSATETANIVNEAVALTEAGIAKNPNLVLSSKTAANYKLTAAGLLQGYNLDLSDKWDRELLDKVALGLQLRDQQASKPQPSTNTATPANGPTSKVMNPNPDPSSPYTVMKSLTDMANTAVATDPGSLPSVIKIPATTNNIHATTIADPEAGKPQILITPLPEQPALDILGTPDQGQENRDKSELPGFTPASEIDNTLSTPTHETKPADLILTRDIPGIDKINDRNPINVDYAGQKYPLEERFPDLAAKYPNGVWFDEKGFPRFEPYIYKDANGIEYKIVSDKLTAYRDNDDRLAEKTLGVETPDGYTWHHVEDGKTLIAVPTDLHKEVKHTGGRARLKEEGKYGNKQ